MKARLRQVLIGLSIIPGILVTISCSKRVDNYVFFYPEPATVTDADSNVYHMVYIKGQTWMAGNLKTTRYRNGEIIPNVTDTAAWRQLQTGACRDYDNDKEKSAVYGKLYNWYAVKQGNLCPVNWHVPYDFEWQALVDSLGGAGAAGGILKEQGTAHWVSNTGATNVYGFSALPGGYSGIDGIFHELGRHAYWWSNTSQPDLILVRSVHYDNATMDRSEREKENGFSVRCVRDY